MPIRVILIDDEQTILDGMKQLINWSEHGFQLIGTFSSPLKALDFSLAHAIDIVVTDVMMPELNGIELSRLLKQQQPETQILILSSYDEFDMVKDSFKYGVADYHLKPRLSPDFFLNSLIAVSQKIKKKPNKSPITDRYEQICENLSQQIAGQTRPLLDPLLFEHTLFFLVYTENRPFSSKQGSKQKQSIIHSLMDSDDSFTIYPFSTFSEESGYVINTDSKDTLRKFVQKFRQEIFPGDFFVVSDSFAIQDINEIFQEIRNCTKGQRFYHKGKNLAYQHELLPLSTNHEQQASSYLTKIVHKDYALAVKELEGFFTTILEQPIDPAYLKHEAINRFYALLNALADEYVGNKELSLLKIALPSLLADAEYLEDFSILVKETLEKLTHFSANAIKDNFDILTLIYEFVQENYEKEINLQLLSEKYHFSYSYLSAIFTEKFGINFSKYLKKVRISKAKLFLTETRLTLTEICEKVGYTELGYFSRVFKEETGMTPSQYRKGTFVK